AEAVERTCQTEASWDALQAAIAVAKAIDAAADATPEQLSAATAAINTALAALRYDYPVLDAFVTWDGSGVARVRVDADREKFVRLVLDDHVVSTSGYTVTSGSTILTLSEDYLNTLSPGSYDFYAEFTDGSAGPLTLTIEGDGGNGGNGGGGNGGGSAGKAPQTGDDAAAIVSFATLLLVTGSALLAVAAARRRQRCHSPNKE
ncbi:MAG: hypothetical protein LBP28_08785, partial [Coriobacteriales bacterium]|nr:hypothetical protein [Coriobacteriales bacterium]